MQKTLSEMGILVSLANYTGDKIARKAMYKLKKIKSDAAGTDSELDNIWNEYCVQVQYEESAFFSIYEDMIEDIVDSLVDTLEDFEKEALWIFTEQAEQWEKDCEGRDIYPVVTEDITKLIMQDHLAPLAMDFSNSKIRRFAQREFDLDE